MSRTVITADRATMTIGGKTFDISDVRVDVVDDEPEPPPRSYSALGTLEISTDDAERINEWVRQSIASEHAVAFGIFAFMLWALGASR